MLEIPKVNQISTFSIPEYQTINLDNNIPVTILQAPDPDVIKLDFVFNAGRYQENDRAVAKTTAILLKEGTKKMNSAKIAQTLDYFGASLSSDASMDTATIQVYCLGKHFKSIIPIIDDIIKNPIFPEEELKKFKSRIIEKLNVELDKNGVQAYRNFTEKIYGSDHAYGYNTIPEDYSNMRREQLIEHFNQNYIPQNCKVFITGNVTDDKIELLNKTIGSIENQKLMPKNNSFSIPEFISGKFKYSTERVHQTAIRIGKRMFDRNHKDYAGMYLLNTIFGGYFGSRLSSNLREDKGYTYGIYSSIDMMLKDGYFSISTDVGSQYSEKTLVEIYKEIELLQKSKVEEKELTLVKNYIKGNFLSLINGHLNSINIIKTIEMAGLEKDFYSKFVDEIIKTDEFRLLELANEYWNIDSFVEIQVGHVTK